MDADDVAEATCALLGEGQCLARAVAVPAMGIRPFLVVSQASADRVAAAVPDVDVENAERSRQTARTWSWESSSAYLGFTGTGQSSGKYIRNGTGTRVYIVNKAVNCTAVGGECYTSASPTPQWDDTGLEGGGGNGTDCALAARAAASSVHIVSVPTVGTSLARLLLSLSLVATLHVDAVAAGLNRRAVVTFAATATQRSSGSSPLADLVEDTLARMRRAGVVSVAAAGNNNTDACQVVARTNTTLIVAAADRRADNKLYRAANSNFGACCDLFGPSDSTDTAAAFVAGVAAGICADLNEPGPAWLVADTILANATKVHVRGRLSTPDLLVHAPLEYRQSPILEPGSEWLPIGLGIFLIVAALAVS